VLQGIAHARGEGRPPIPFRLAARIGLIGAGIVAAAVPTSEDHQRVRLRFLLVYLAEAAGISVGFWQDWPVLTKFAIGAFVLTAAANAGLWLVAGLLKLGSLRSSWLWVTGSLALALAAGGVLTLAVFQMLRTADGPWLWLVSAVALGLIALGVLARTPPARQAGAPPATEDEQRRAKRRRWIRLALIALGAGWFLVMGWLQLVHVGETRDWIPIVSHPSPPAA
jgi:hypothetical protein